MAACSAIVHAVTVVYVIEVGLTNSNTLASVCLAAFQIFIRFRPTASVNK